MLRDDVIYHVCNYQPYRKCGERNPNADANTFHIMNLKNENHIRHQHSAFYLGVLVNTYLNQIFDSFDYFQIAVVPSSEMLKLSSGLEIVINNITSHKYNYQRGFLVRTNTVPKSHEGGDRTMFKHTSSVQVQHPIQTHLPTLLIDDVTTSGNSLFACSNILKAAGAGKVYMLAIGRTV